LIKSEIVESAEPLREEWQELVEGSDLATPFQSWEWQSLWLKHYGAGKTSKILTLREGQDLVGIAPFVQTNLPWKTLRWAGGGPSDYLHPIARTGHESHVASEVIEFLASTKVDLIDLHQIRETQPILSQIATSHKNHPSQQIDLGGCLVLSLPKRYDDYLKTLSKSLRYDVRKLDKEMFASGRATIQNVTLENVGHGFQLFLDQHRARWRARKLPGAFLGASLRFHRDWVQTASQNGWLRLQILRIEGEPAGAIYAMRFHQTLYYYQAGFDPNFRHLSPGSLLVANAIRQGIEEGAQVFDFMRGAEPYKRRWKPQDEYHNLRVLISRGTLAGDQGLRWNRLASRVEMKVRSRLEGATGS
jgi:CelD/BcsL family acetyltransferase involved in cellulose biosynthesis